MNNTRIINIKTISTEGMGDLSFFEELKDIPFEIKRIYYTYNVPVQTKRGGHAHKDLQQILFCPYGKIKVLLDNGYEKEEFTLSSPNNGLLIGNNIWRDMIWEQENSVLCVAASKLYSENDYIRDYKEFLELIRK